jgi:large subunit ribosomal protein L25
MAIIQAQTRTGTGKGVARQLRRAARIPAVLYGAGTASLSLSVDRKTWLRLQEKEAGSLRTKPQTLVIDEQQRQLVLLRDVQYHPLTEAPLHLDLLRFDPNREIDIEVPVDIVDEDQCPGLKRGGMVQLIRRELDITCVAGKIPESIIVSVAGLDIGDVIHISEMTLPEGVEVHREVDFTVVTIVGVKDESEELEAEAVESPEAITATATTTTTGT